MEPIPATIAVADVAALCEMALICCLLFFVPDFRDGQVAGSEDNDPTGRRNRSGKSGRVHNVSEIRSVSTSLS